MELELKDIFSPISKLDCSNQIDLETSVQVVGILLTLQILQK